MTNNRENQDKYDVIQAQEEFESMIDPRVQVLKSKISELEAEVERIGVVNVERQLGVRLPSGKVERIAGDPEDILEATLSVAEYAHARAKALGGEVVQRTRTITVSDWSEWK